MSAAELPLAQDKVELPLAQDKVIPSFGSGFYLRNDVAHIPMTQGQCYGSAPVGKVPRKEPWKEPWKGGSAATRTEAGPLNI